VTDNFKLKPYKETINVANAILLLLLQRHIMFLKNVVHMSIYCTDSTVQNHPSVHNHTSFTQHLPTPMIQAFVTDCVGIISSRTYICM